MNRYKVYYGEIEIGLFENDIDNNKQKYTPIKENIQKIVDDIFLPMDLLNESDWVKSISFFNNRIINCSRFEENPKVIGYHTDDYRLVLIEE